MTQNQNPTPKPAAKPQNDHLSNFMNRPLHPEIFNKQGKSTPLFAAESDESEESRNEPNK